MASAGVNVLRYSALVGGVLYGVYHQSVVRSRQKINQVDAQYKQQAILIDKAKAEWTKRTMPADKKTAGGGIITDPMDPKFDLEAYLTMTQSDYAGI
ncbi:MAG: hypothetical protein Q9163_003569 [Psora crenata]